MAKIYICLCLIAVLINLTFAFDKDTFIKLGKQCKEDTKTSDDDVKKLMNKELPDSSEAKCMLSCIFKAMGVMTDDGKFDQEGNEQAAAKAFDNDKAKINRSKKYATLCKENIDAVEDDSNGCERAHAMLKCAMDNSKELGYDEE